MASILCVEDEVSLRQDIAEELTEAGHTVHEAADGAAGLARIVSDRPDLVISDITMPEMNGYEMVNAVRENHPDLADIPIIFLSALAHDGDVVEGLKRGADDYLTKPVDFDLMIAKVEAQLRQAERMRRRKEEELADLVKAFESISADDFGDSGDVIWK